MLPAPPPLPLRRFTKPRTQRFPPFPAHKRPVLDRAVCGFAAIDIAAVLWLPPKHLATIQLPRTKQSFPKSVQHQDGCRRRLSIRQTRRPKPARSFWCLFLKKARLFVTETLVPASRAITAPATAHAFFAPRHTAFATTYALLSTRPPRYGTVAVAYAPFSNWFENRPGYTASAAASASAHPAPSITRPGTR